jgi:hypothetical protein
MLATDIPRKEMPALAKAEHWQDKKRHPWMKRVFELLQNRTGPVIEYGHISFADCCSIFATSPLFDALNDSHFPTVETGRLHWK